MLPYCRAPEWLAISVTVYAMIDWSDQSGEKIPQSLMQTGYVLVLLVGSKESCATESEISAHRGDDTSTPISAVSHIWREAVVFLIEIAMLLFTYAHAHRNKQHLVKLRFVSATVIISWDEFACSHSGGISFPARHVLELHFSSSPSSSAQYMLSLSIFSACFFPRAFMLCE